MKYRLLSNSIIYLAANVLNAGIPFLLLPILTRILTPADYGIIAMFFLMQSIFGAFVGLNVQGAIAVRYFQISKEALPEYVGACVGILIVSTCIVLVLVVLFGNWLVEVSGVPLDWLLVAVAICSFQFIGSIRLSLWQASGAIFKYGIFQVSQSFLNGMLSLVLVVLIGMAWQGRVLGQSLALMLFGMIAFWLLVRDGQLRISSFSRKHSLNALKFGVPLVPHVIGGLLIIATDRFMIVRLLDVSQAGIYMVALQVGQGLGLITESFNKSFAPWLMKSLIDPTETLRIKIVRGTYLYFLLMAILVISLCYLTPIIISILVGESYRLAGNVVVFIMLGFAAGGCYFMVTNYIFFAGKTKLLSLVSIVSGLINVPLMYYLVTRNGIVGAGQAFMLTNILSFIGTWWLAHKTYPMPWLKALNFKLN